MIETSDFLVLGSGVAGMSFALRAAKFGTVGGDLLCSVCLNAPPRGEYPCRRQ